MGSSEEYFADALFRIGSGQDITCEGDAGGTGGGNSGTGGGGNEDQCASDPTDAGPVAISATTIQATVDGNGCPKIVCSVTMTNNHGSILTMSTNFPVDAPVTFVNDSGLAPVASVIGAGETLTLDVQLNDCSQSQNLNQLFEFTDEVDDFKTVGDVTITVDITVEE